MASRRFLMLTPEQRRAWASLQLTRDQRASESGPGAGVDNLLLENDGNLLLESGDAILLE